MNGKHGDTEDGSFLAWKHDGNETTVKLAKSATKTSGWIIFLHQAENRWLWKKITQRFLACERLSHSEQFLFIVLWLKELNFDHLTKCQTNNAKSAFSNMLANQHPGIQTKMTFSHYHIMYCDVYVWHINHHFESTETVNDRQIFRPKRLPGAPMRPLSGRLLCDMLRQQSPHDLLPVDTGGSLPSSCQLRHRPGRNRGKALGNPWAVSRTLV